MHMTKVLALVALFAGTAFAAPAADAGKPPPPKPTPPPPSNSATQTNVCGNNVTPYCCTSDGFGTYSSCYAMNGGSQCSVTIVCCNAQDSVQVCIGNANIVIGH